MLTQSLTPFQKKVFDYIIKRIDKAYVDNGEHVLWDGIYIDKWENDLLRELKLISDKGIIANYPYLSVIKGKEIELMDRDGQIDQIIKLQTEKGGQIKYCVYWYEIYLSAKQEWEKCKYAETLNTPPLPENIF